MPMDPKIMRRSIYWTLALSLIALIFISDVVGRKIVNILKADIPFKAFVFAGFLSFLIFLFIFLYWRLALRKISTYILLCCALGLYSYLALIIVREPEETIHYLEFSGLAYLICRAVFIDFRGLRGWLAVIGLMVFFSWSAEYLQLYVPGRVYDPQDMVMNAVGSLCGLVFTLIILWEKKSFYP